MMVAHLVRRHDCVLDTMPWTLHIRHKSVVADTIRKWAAVTTTVRMPKRVDDAKHSSAVATKLTSGFHGGVPAGVC